MARQKMIVEQLTGVDRNRVPGSNPDGILSPQKAYNLTPDRRGGYVPFGRVNPLGVKLENMHGLLGYDTLGVASFGVVEIDESLGEISHFELFKGSSIYVQEANDYDDEDTLQSGVHIPGAGAYLDRERYMVFHRSGDIAEPMVMETAVETRADESGGVAEDRPTTQDFTDIEHGNGVWIACTSGGKILRSTDDGVTWAEEVDDVGEWYEAVATDGSGRWVVVGRDDRIRFSSDGGENWSIASVPTSSKNIYDVCYVTGTTFAATGENCVIVSTDGGATWTLKESPFQTGTVIMASGAIVTAVMDGPPAGHGATFNELQVSENGGVEFNSRWGNDNGGKGCIAGSNFWDNAQAGCVDDIGRMVMVSAEGGTIVSSMNGNCFSRHVTNLTSAAMDIAFNDHDNTYLIVGTGGVAMESPDLVSWTPIEAFSGMTTSEDIHAVAVSDDGVIVMVGADGLVIATKTSLGLDAGRYKVHLVSYFNTEAGKFVFDYQIQDATFTEETGNNIEVQVSGSDKVSADTLATFGYTPDADVLSDVRVDVYLQYFGDDGEVGDTSEGVDATTTTSRVESLPLIVYDFTATLPDGSDVAAIGTVTELPIGTRLGGSANAMTSIVFGYPQTAVHNGRVWGLMSQDEDRWPQDDGAPLEIANQHGGFVLGYTEPNWVNFMRPDNFVPLIPGQSTNFTGMISTPSGLMVMFDNEIILVSGDPVLGGLAVELYSDLVGNDDGVTPCKIGGIPFVVWDGQIYALSGGQAQPISAPVYRQDDPFVQIVPEPQERSLLALTESGEVYRYEIEHQFWSNNTVQDVSSMLPNCVCTTGDNTRFVRDSGNVYTVRRDGTPTTPYLVYRGIDYGDSLSRHALYRFQLPVDGFTAGVQIPRLYYKINGDHEDVEDAAATYVEARHLEELMEFTLPHGMKSRLHDLKLELRGATYDTVVLPTLVLDYSTVGSRR